MPVPPADTRIHWKTRASDKDAPRDRPSNRWAFFYVRPGLTYFLSLAHLIAHDETSGAIDTWVGIMRKINHPGGGPETENVVYTERTPDFQEALAKVEAALVAALAEEAPGLVLDTN